MEDFSRSYRWFGSRYGAQSDELDTHAPSSHLCRPSGQIIEGPSPLSENLLKIFSQLKLNTYVLMNFLK